MEYEIKPYTPVTEKHESITHDFLDKVLTLLKSESLKIQRYGIDDTYTPTETLELQLADKRRISITLTSVR